MQKDSSFRALELVDNLINFVESSRTSSFSSGVTVTTQKQYKGGIRMSATTATATSTSDEKEELLTNVYQNGTAPLKDVDPDVYAIIKAEEERQRVGLELIASEVMFCFLFCLLLSLHYITLKLKFITVIVDPCTFSILLFIVLF